MESPKLRLKRMMARLVRATVIGWRKLRGRDGPVIVNRSGIVWECDLNEVIDLTMFVFGRWERSSIQTYRALLNPGDTVIDIGANVGAHTLPLASIVGPKGMVLACEPTQWGYSKLVRNLSLNPRLAMSVLARQVMLMSSGAQEPPNALFASWPVEHSDDLHQDHAGRSLPTHGASVSTLDDLVSETGLRWIHFIKIDVDGAEPDVLQGAKRTVARCKPIILLEWAPCLFEARRDEVDQMFTFLDDLGYCATSPETQQDIQLISDEIWSVVPARESINLLLTARNSAGHAASPVDSAAG